MPNIRPVSDLRNYGEVLKEISVDAPVFLTKNGSGRIPVFKRLQACLGNGYDGACLFGT